LHTGSTVKSASMANILVIEDEPAIAESISYALRREGYHATSAGTLAEAEQSLDGVDLIVLDLMLPDGSGFDLIDRVRREARTTAIIVLSSRDAEADRVAALETGADDYVTKPFSPREIVARVRAVLRRAHPRTDQSPVTHSPPGPSTTSGPGNSPSVTEAPLHVDEASRRAFVLGAPVELTRVEFDLLACLLGMPGRVFTRMQLIDRVWGDGFAITDRTIDSHVKSLRRKVVEAGGHAGMIETVRGVGYRVMTDLGPGAAAR
jgi:DNA-binding response OmpR family regulator